MIFRQSDNELDRRGFIRSVAVLGAGAGATALVGACSEGAQRLTGANHDSAVTGRKWVRMDAMDMESGNFISLDGFSDDPSGALTSDFMMSGYSVSSAGGIDPIELGFDDGDDSTALSLVSVSGDLYRLEAGGVPQPPGAPYAIHLVERTITGTDVTVLTGYLLDPTSGKRVVFSVTHDPLPALIVVAIAAGIIFIAAAAAYRLACGSAGGKMSINVGPSGTSATFSCHDQGRGG